MSITSEKSDNTINQTTPYYTEYWIEKPIELKKGKKKTIKLKSGYYRIKWGLSDNGYNPDDSQYSKDRCNWKSCSDLYKNIDEFTKLFEKIGEAKRPMKFERLEYVETIVYKNQYVPVFYDDYGQCYYCILNNKEVSFGTFQTEYEDEVKAIIDFDLAKKKSQKSVNTI